MRVIGGCGDEGQSVTRFGGLRVLAVSVFLRPRPRRRFAHRPLLPLGEPSVEPHHEATVGVVHEHLWRRDVRVEVLEVLGWVGLRTVEGRVRHRHGARLVNPPRTFDPIGVGEADEGAHVMGQVHVVAAERTLDPVRHADDRRPVDVVAERWRRLERDERVLRQPSRGDASWAVLGGRIGRRHRGQQRHGEAEPTVRASDSG